MTNKEREKEYESQTLHFNIKMTSNLVIALICYFTIPHLTDEFLKGLFTFFMWFEIFEGISTIFVYYYRCKKLYPSDKPNDRNKPGGSKPAI